MVRINFKAVRIIRSFTSLITTVEIRLAKHSNYYWAFKIHLIRVCLLSVAHNYLCSSSPLTYFWQWTDYCKLLEYYTTLRCTTDSTALSKGYEHKTLSCRTFFDSEIKRLNILFCIFMAGSTALQMDNTVYHYTTVHTWGLAIGSVLLGP